MTGGYRHEKFLFDALVAYWGKKGEVSGRLFRKPKLFESLVGYIELLVWSFFRSNADLNIVTGRTGVSAMLRNWFNKKEVYIVLHNFDPNDGKSELLAFYYRILFRLLRAAGHQRFRIIAVAPYFVKYFKELKGVEQTDLFPNLFNTKVYSEYVTAKKEQWVHLGQYSAKNDPEIFALAARLQEAGYYCYFSTLNEREARPHNGYFEVIHFASFADYLQHMARCCCTLALTKINEGWPRLTHESLLVGTPVIGYANGGLSDLLKESNSIIVKNIEEAYICIMEAIWVLPSEAFIEKYDTARTEYYLEQLWNRH